MNWLIFGDDFGNHPSTTQHIAVNLPKCDSIIWVNSLGMRSPGFNFSDLSRIVTKGVMTVRNGQRNGSLCHTLIPRNLTVIHPLVLPWHASRFINRYNRYLLHPAIRNVMRKREIDTFVVLAAYPYAARYVDGLPHAGLAYLRLDDYPNLPGMDSSMAQITEKEMYRKSDWIVATAEVLLPSKEVTDAHLVYLPQGVDVSHFSVVPSTPPKRRVLGFYGLMAEWIDFELAERLAQSVPDWTLEFVGPARHIPDWFVKVANIRISPGVDYMELPRLMENWDAAWIPFKVDDMTRGVNPIKLREYLAAGLPTLCTPLPEAEKLVPHVEISDDSHRIKAWLEEVYATDDSSRRESRKRSVQRDSWSSRTLRLREIICSGCTDIRDANPE